MRSVGDFLVGDTTPYDFFRGFHGRGPIEPGSECFGYKHPTARVVSAGAFVNLEQQILVVFFIDALLEYLRDAALVQLSVDHREHLGSPADAPCFVHVLR